MGKVTLFKNKFLDSALQKILDEVDPKQQCDVRNIVPKAIELDLHDEVNLVVNVHWTEGITEQFHLHRFLDDEEVGCRFFGEMLNSPGIKVSFSPIKKGAKAIKYLQQFGINGVLRELFIEGSTTYTATLKSKKISLEGVSSGMSKKLLRHMKKMKFSRWL